MIDGIIIKGIGGFYYVKTDDGIIESRARGVFREDNLTPLVGDKVKIRISPEDKTGYVVEIAPRKSQLLRPPVANITQAIVVMSVKKPDINLWLLDKFLLMAEYEGLDILICLNKSDLDMDRALEYMNIYEKAGYDVVITSAKEEMGIDKLKSRLLDNISVFAGPSGAGKSSLLNKINSSFQLETGDVSAKTKRGKHTTRHVELLELYDNAYVLDSPGFSSLSLDFMEDEVEVREYFREIYKYGDECRFLSCLHDKEPDCAIKSYVEDGTIHRSRYDNYLLLLNEVKNIRRY
ncbi:MAG: ribosome small subunit-dependent GTPase A [Tissierellaceae bacterium]